LNRDRILLEGPAKRLLRRKPPLLQVAAHCPHRKRGPKSLLDEGPDRFPSPQVKGQLELIGMAIGDRPYDLRRLSGL
jgi:hypothetical protein